MNRRTFLSATGVAVLPFVAAEMATSKAKWRGYTEVVEGKNFRDEIIFSNGRLFYQCNFYGCQISLFGGDLYRCRILGGIKVGPYHVHRPGFPTPLICLNGSGTVTDCKIYLSKNEIAFYGTGSGHKQTKNGGNTVFGKRIIHLHQASCDLHQGGSDE